MAEQKYLHRIIDTELSELLEELPAIAIEGAKGVGKTETALQYASSVFRLDDEAQLLLAKADPKRLLDQANPVLLDEWQRLPSLWDYVRRAVDGGAKPGSFLLTGSAAPLNSPTHSGAGRVVTLRMRPLSLQERGLCKTTVSLTSLLNDDLVDINGSSPMTLTDYTDEILKSGFPGIRKLKGKARRLTLEGYINRIVDRDFEEQGIAVRRPDTLLRWMRAYAAATATTTSYETIRDAASAGEATSLAKTTTIPYRDTLKRLWITESLPAWLPTRNQLSKLAKAPKHHLADPALAAQLLGATQDSLLTGQVLGPMIPRDGTLLGHLFESLATLCIRVYAQHSEAKVFHLRTPRNAQEVDLIVERPDGRIVALEVKLSPEIGDRDVRHLHWLKAKLGEDLLDAVVLTTGPYAYRRKDGIAVVPLALLGV